MLNKEEEWNGAFVFSVLAVNQFGFSESSEVSVNLKGTWLFNVYTRQHDFKCNLMLTL